MLLSVIVPAYNVEKYIEKCVKSILTQRGIKYEVIIINDGSTDSTLSIAQEFEKKYSNVRVIDKKNNGVGDARNTGIKNARGKYIAFVDSDDYLYPNTYGILFDIIGNELFDVACFNFIKVYEDQNDISYNEKISKILIEKEDIMKNFYIDNITSYVWDKVYSINLFKENKIFFPEKKLYEDLRTIYEVMKKAEKVIKIDLNGYMYLQRKDSSTKKVKKKNFDDFISEYKKVLDSIDRDKNYSNLEEEIMTYKVLKNNVLVRMKMRAEDKNYIINKPFRYRAPLRKLLFNRYLGMNEKVINIIGENRVLFNILKIFKGK